MFSRFLCLVLRSPASKPKAVKGGAAKGKNTKRPKKAPTPREAKEIPLKKKKKETPRSASSKATHSANQPIQPAKQTKKTKTMKATRADEASASAPQAFRKLRKKVTTTQEPEKVKKKLKKKSQGSGNDHQNLGLKEASSFYFVLIVSCFSPLHRFLGGLLCAFFANKMGALVEGRIP